MSESLFNGNRPLCQRHLVTSAICHQRHLVTREQTLGDKIIEGVRIDLQPGGGYSKKFYTVRLRPEVQPLTLPFYTPFFQKRDPFRIPFIGKRHPFHIPS